MFSCLLEFLISEEKKTRQCFILCRWKTLWPWPPSLNCLSQRPPLLRIQQLDVIFTEERNKTLGSKWLWKNFVQGDATYCRSRPSWTTTRRDGVFFTGHKINVTRRMSATWHHSGSLWAFLSVLLGPMKRHRHSIYKKKKMSAIQWRVLVSVCLEKFERFTEPETPLLAQTPNTACSQVIQHGRLQQSLNTCPSVLVHVWILPMSRVTDAVS